MTKKDYVRIADAVWLAKPTEAEHEQGTATSGWAKVIGELADALGAENPKFDRAKFISACGLTE